MDDRLQWGPWPQTRGPRGVVVMLHGGAEHGHQPVDDGSLQLRRSRWMFRSIEPEIRAAGVRLALLRFTVKGWNAPTEAAHGAPDSAPSPVRDLRATLPLIRGEHPEVPIVLLGHSMGARTAAAAADELGVVGVIGLAPWFPADDPVEHLGGVHLVAAHGRRDKITSPRASRRFIERATAHAASAEFIDMGSRGHYLLRGVRGWNQVAVRSSLTILDRVPGAAAPDLATD